MKQKGRGEIRDLHPPEGRSRGGKHHDFRTSAKDESLRSINDVLLYGAAAPASNERGQSRHACPARQQQYRRFLRRRGPDDVQYFRDFYNVDRVEVLKGPNAMIFGRGGGGGIVNRVIKRSTAQVSRILPCPGDSGGGFRLTGDVNQRLNDAVGVRANGLYEDGDSFRNHVDLKRYGINPTVGIQAGKRPASTSATSISMTAGLPRGVPSVSDPTAVDEPLKGFDSDFFGDPDKSYAKVEAHIGVVAVEHDFGNGLTLRNRTSYGHFDKFYQNIFAANLNETDPIPERSRSTATTTAPPAKICSARPTLSGRTVLAASIRRCWSDLKSAARSPAAVVKRRPSPGRRLRFRWPIRRSISTGMSASRALARTPIIAQGDRCRSLCPGSDPPGRLAEIVAGLRFDSFKLSVDDFRPTPFGGEFDRRDKFWSPRLGLILKPNDRLSIYGSFSRSYLPQSGDQFGGLDIDTAALKPERFDNVEIGAKWQPVAGLLATAAVYQLDRTNTRIANPDGSGTFQLSGKQRSKGIELGAPRKRHRPLANLRGLRLQKAKRHEQPRLALLVIARFPCAAPHSRKEKHYDVTQSLGLGLGVIAREEIQILCDHQQSG